MTCRSRSILVAHLIATAFVLAPVRQAAATFTNVTSAVGINHWNDPKTFMQTIALSDVEFLSGGAAAGDFDNDGWVDLYFTRYYAPDVLYRNIDDGNGNRIFSDVTSSTLGAIPTRNTNGAAWGDVDNDGDLDIYVTSIGKAQHYLYVNDGAGHFTEEAVARGASVGDIGHTTSGTSVSFGDYDNDGWLDMYVGEWKTLAEQSVPVQARLLRNLGAANPGHFEDTTVAAGASTEIPSGRTHSFTPRFVDFDRDGHQDIAIASDYDASHLFWNNGDGTFTDGTGSMDVNLGHNDMGFAVGDVNGDGLLDWYNTDIYNASNPNPPHDGNRLFINNGDRTFTDTTTTAHVRDTGFGWGTEMFDHDNDSDLDLIATNGYYTNQDRNYLLENNRNGSGLGVFTDRTLANGITDLLNGPSELDNVDQGRGLLTFDYDKDGDVDFMVINNHQAPLLYRNNGNSNKWLEIETIGTLSNRNGIGAFITVTPDTSQPNNVLVWEVEGSANYLAQSEMIAHFGLGTLAGTIDLVEIEWPASGVVQQFTAVAPNQRLTIVERVADYNGDGKVSAADFTVWRDCLGSVLEPGTGADGNRDGLVDELDFDFWRKTYGMEVLQTTGSGAGTSAAMVPEPYTGALVGMGFLAFGVGRIMRAG